MKRTNLQCKMSSFCIDLTFFSPSLAEKTLYGGGGGTTDDVQEIDIYIYRKTFRSFKETCLILQLGETSYSQELKIDFQKLKAFFFIIYAFLSRDDDIPRS